MDKNELTVGVGQLWQDYAREVGHALSGDEKKQVMLNAILAGKRVEPFATFNEWMRKASRIGEIVEDALAEVLTDDSPPAI